MRFEPLGDRTLIRRTGEVADKIGGLYIPDNVKEKPREGEVLAAGEGRYEDGKFRPLSVQPGDKVLFGKYAGSETKVNDEELLIMREDEILGILRDV